MAEEVSVPALASTTIPARTSLTKVHPGLTVMTSESFLAATLQGKGLQTIFYQTISVHAQCLPSTSLAAESTHLVTVDSVNTGSSIQARACSAVIVVRLTEPSTEATLASAGEGVDIILAGGAVLARVHCTLVHILLTVLATEAGNAETLGNIKIIDCF